MVKLRKLGWSTRRIAEVVGVAASTVSEDLNSSVRNRTVEFPTHVIGRDGKRRPATKPKPPLSVIAPTIWRPTGAYPYRYPITLPSRVCQPIPFGTEKHTFLIGLACKHASVAGLQRGCV